MPEQVDLEQLAMTREFTYLRAVLGIRTPRKLDEIARLSKAIRQSRRAPAKVKGKR